MKPVPTNPRSTNKESYAGTRHNHRSRHQEHFRNRVVATPTDEAEWVGREARISGSYPYPRFGANAEYIRQLFDQWRLYHFHDTSSTSPMKTTADLNDNRYLRSDGSNLAAYLYLLSQMEPI